MIFANQHVCEYGIWNPLLRPCTKPAVVRVYHPTLGAVLLCVVHSQWGSGTAWVRETLTIFRRVS